VTIHIEDLTLLCIIGILESERKQEQKLIVNLELDYEYKDTYLDYAKLVELISEQLKVNRFELLEEALESLFQSIYQKYPNTKELFIKLAKPAILPSCSVGVSKRKQFS
jgi:7,8-dihydroneopterin aldolase/epimerase/oxygenase